MQQPNQQHQQEYINLTSIQRHLERLDERLDERTRDLATKQDVEALRKDMVTQNYLESRLTLFNVQIARMEQDRTEYRKEVDEQFEKVEKRFEAMKTEQTSRSERLWMRISPIIGVLAFLLALLEFLSHVRFTP